MNKRRSKALHLLSVHQTIAEQGAVEDWDKARTELAKPDGLIIINPGFKMEIQQNGAMAEGQFKLLQQATNEMQLSGPNAAMSGQDDRELSGRAILAQQAGGAAQNEPLADGLRMWTRRCMEMSWQAVREFWTAGKWVRVTDDLGDTRWVGVNQPIRLMDELAAMPEAQRVQAMQRMQIQPDDPRLSQVIRIENNVTDLEVDIVIQEGIDIPSLQQEQFQTLVQLAGIAPNPAVPMDVIIAASGLKDKDKLLEMLQQHEQEAQAKAQQAAPMVQAHAEATIAQMQGQAAANFALAKERTHNTVNTIANTHATFNEMQQPPDPPSAPGTAGAPPMPPAMQAAHDLADLRAKHAKAGVDEMRQNDLLHTAVKRIADVHMIHHTITNPPPPPKPAGGK